ncbi:MAG: GrpB family protein [Thermaerobacter sp.]|nr:GrpB family protein [Thermaerobacter sp.]
MRVVVTEPDAAWPRQFRMEAERLASVFGRHALFIHHIGSTSVPGLAAKPVIDILPVVRQIAAVDALTPSLQQLGYEAMGEYGLQGRRYFRREDPPPPCHVHVYERGDPEILRHLAVRDYLRARPEAAARYGRLKAELAARFPEDIEGYMDGKDAFLKRTERDALAWWNTVPVLVLSGPVGVGKSTVADALSDLLAAHGVAHALSDLDALSEVEPRSPGDRFASGFALANLQALFSNARACGARCLIVPRVVEGEGDVADIRSAVPGADVLVVRLRAPLPVLEQRLRRREQGESLAWHLVRAAELSAALDRSGPPGHVVEAGDASPERIARRILDATGLLGRLA